MGYPPRPPHFYKNSWFPTPDFSGTPTPYNKRVVHAILRIISWNSPNGEIDKGYIWIWLTIETYRNQNASYRWYFKQ